MLNRLTDSLDFQGQALQLRSERQRLIASNIANADTPGYIARDMDFAKTLKAATGSLPAAGALATSHAGHLGAGAYRTGIRLHLVQPHAVAAGPYPFIDRHRKSSILASRY